MISIVKNNINCKKMKLTTKNSFSQNIPSLLRQCGYLRIFDQKSGKESFVRKISTEHYPRFHLYIKEDSEKVIFDLHLDQKSNIYQGQKAHSADYDSPEVKSELQRIAQIVARHYKS